MQTTLLGFFEYDKKDRNTNKKTGDKYIMATIIANPIPKDKGDGYYTKNYYISSDVWNERFTNVKAGKVEIEIDPFNSYNLISIKNI